MSPWQKVEAEPYQIKLLDLKWHYMTPCDTCIKLYEFHYTAALGTSIALVLTLLLYFLFLFCPDRGVKVEKYGPDKLHKMFRIGSNYCRHLWCQIVPTQESPWIFVGVYRWHARSNSQCEVRWLSQQRGKKRDTFRTNTGTLTNLIHAVCAMLTLERGARHSQIFPCLPFWRTIHASTKSRPGIFASNCNRERDLERATNLSQWARIIRTICCYVGGLMGKK